MRFVQIELGLQNTELGLWPKHATTTTDSKHASIAEVAVFITR